MLLLLSGSHDSSDVRVIIPLGVIIGTCLQPCSLSEMCVLRSKKNGIDLGTPEAKRRRVMTLYSGHYALEQARGPARS